MIEETKKCDYSKARTTKYGNCIVTCNVSPDECPYKQSRKIFGSDTNPIFSCVGLGRIPMPKKSLETIPEVVKAQVLV